MNTLAERFQEALDMPDNIRNKKDIAYLSKITGASKANLYNILNGDNKNPKDTLLKSIADELGVEFLYLKYGETRNVNLNDSEILPHLSEKAKEVILNPKNASLINTMSIVKGKDWRTWDQNQWDLFNEIIKLALEESEK